MSRPDTPGLSEFYNNERMHQSLGNRTPAEVYRTADGGGAMIVDRFSKAVLPTPTPMEIRGSAEPLRDRLLA